MADTSIDEAVKEAEFAFLVVKQKDGRLAIANVNSDNTERQPSLEDVYNSISTLEKDLDRQSLTMSIIAALSQTSSQASKLVVPEKKFVKRV